MIGQLDRPSEGDLVFPLSTTPAGPPESTTLASWLPAARVAWAVLAVASLGWFLVGVALGYGQLMHVTGETRQSLAEAGLSPANFALLRLSLDSAFVAVFTVMGWVIYLRRRADWMALLTALALVVWGPHNGSLVGTGYGPPTAGLMASIGAAAVGLLSYGSWMLFLYLFPSGRFVPRWTRACAVAWVVMVVLWAATPFGPPHWPAVPRLALLILLWGSFPVSQLYRYWRVSTPTQCLQTKWVVFGVAAGVIGDRLVSVLLGGLASPQTGDTVGRLAANGLEDAFVALIPVSIGIAILKHRLFDIDLIINRTLVYGGLTALVIGGYVLIVGYLGALFQAHDSLLFSLLATGLVAVAFQPVRQRLQLGVNHLLYGERDDPYAAIARLGRQLDVALAPDAILPTIVTTLRQSMNLPYAAIVLPDQTVVASGEPRGEILRLPLVHAGEPVGNVLLSPRARGEGWTTAEHRLLNDLAHTAGAAVQTVRLTSELLRSREKLVVAREEERRRLRRDLHDELAPSLAALALTAATAAEFMPPEAARSRRLVEELRQALRESVGTVRHLAHELRPPTLDELGLIAAIRERAEQYSSETPLKVEVDAPVVLTPVSAAAEVAAYRIVQEALMNVVRHSQARHCLIQLALVPASTMTGLEITITDDGAGLPDFGAETGHRIGIGLRSMEERAMELGGRWSIERPPEGGTCVRAYLPAGKAEKDAADGIESPATPSQVV